MITAKEAREIMSSSKKARLATHQYQIQGEVSHMAKSGFDQTSIVLPRDPWLRDEIVSWLNGLEYQLEASGCMLKISW